MTQRMALALALVLPFLAGAARAQTPLADAYSGCGSTTTVRTLNATPANYRTVLRSLQAGDRLLLAGGTYTQQIPLKDVNGQPGRCIVIEGPASGTPARFTGSDTANTISLRNVSYLVFRNLLLDGANKMGDGVKVEKDSVYAHHVTLERLKLVSYAQDLQRCGISTKARAWNFVIRHVDIRGAGVGMYLGGSDGSAEFVNSLIEHNVVADSKLYNLQIKHQLGRATALGIPSTGTTVIRYNVFSKASGAATGTNARPSVLVGHWPLSGPGSTDIYQVYGNFFWDNPTEAHFQGEGNIALHDNLFVQRRFDRTVRIQRHNDLPRRIEIFHNTIVARGEGIAIYTPNTAYRQLVRGNAVFAAKPLIGGSQAGNVTGSLAAAADHLVDPFGGLGAVDLFPKPGKLQATGVDTTFASGLVDWNVDFNRMPRLSSFRGAYSDDGVNTGWQPALQIMP